MYNTSGFDYFSQIASKMKLVKYRSLKNTLYTCTLNVEPSFDSTEEPLYCRTLDNVLIIVVSLFRSVLIIEVLSKYTCTCTSPSLVWNLLGLTSNSAPVHVFIVIIVIIVII